MPTLANPYVIIGAILGFISIAVGGFFYGEHVEGLAWKTSIAEMKVKAADELLTQTNKVHDQERQIADLSNEVETTHAEDQSKIDNADRKLADYIRDHGGLRVPPGHGSSGHSAGPANPASAASGNEAAPGCQLSIAISDDLRILTRDADDVVATARACQLDDAKLRTIISTRKK